MVNFHFLDNASTTKLAPEVIDTLLKYSSEIYANPSSIHKMGVSSSKAISLSRRLISGYIGANEEQIVFTSGATESNNLIIHSALSSQNNGIFLTSEIEHPSILETIKNKTFGNYRLLKTDKNGVVIFSDEDISVIIRSPFISIIHTNNELGTIQNIIDIKKMLDRHGFKGIFHVDATQSLGKLMINVNELGVDALSASAHKFHGPKGTGFLYVKDPSILKTLNFGGNQERGYRSGTENLAGICTMAKALSISIDNLEKNYVKVKAKKDRIIDYVEKKNPFIKLTISKETSQSPYILSLCYFSLPSEVLLHMYEERGIILSSGSACSSNKNKISHVLKAIGMENEENKSVLRISFSGMTTDEDITAFLDATDFIINNIR